MKKFLCFILDFAAIFCAFVATDIVMYNLQTEDPLTDFLVFLGFSVVFEGGIWLVTKLLGLRKTK